MCDENKTKIELWVSPEQFKEWETQASFMYLNVYEYIRRCVDAHTNILKADKMGLVNKRHLTE